MSLWSVSEFPSLSLAQTKLVCVFLISPCLFGRTFVLNSRIHWLLPLLVIELYLFFKSSEILPSELHISFFGFQFAFRTLLFIIVDRFVHLITDLLFWPLFLFIPSFCLAMWEQVAFISFHFISSLQLFNLHFIIPIRCWICCSYLFETPVWFFSGVQNVSAPKLSSLVIISWIRVFMNSCSNYEHVYHVRNNCWYCFGI